MPGPSWDLRIFVGLMWTKMFSGSLVWDFVDFCELEWSQVLGGLMRA